MLQKDEELLFRDLCARLPYGVKVCLDNIKETTFSVNELLYLNSKHNTKPYLRPMENMTEEEFKEYYSMLKSIEETGLMNIEAIANVVAWLNSGHFDYRGLIEKGLAIEAPENMYKLD